MEHLEDLLLVKARNESQLLNRPGVTAVDVGYKYVDGKKTDELAIRIHVKKKTSEVPLAEMIPAQIEDFRTDVLEGDYELQVLKQSASMLTADTGNYNPLVGGISIGPCRVVGGFIYAGTLGVPVTDRTTGKPMLLSNFHVMCVDTGWHPGDSICQPSLIDTGKCPSDTMSGIARAALGGSIDGAVAQQTQRSSVRSIVDVGQIDGVSPAYPGHPVRKRGRTTGLTFGAVDGVGGSVTVDYGNAIGRVTLNNQISIAPDTSRNPSFSDHGDSGSVVVNVSNQVIGLLFAGVAGGLTWANPIQNALDALQVDIWATFEAVFAHGDPGNGIGGYDLASPDDRAFAFDYDGSGKLDHIALYRPGHGTFWILKRNGNDFEAVFAHGAPGNGIGGYDLASPADLAFAFDYDGSGKLDHIALYRPGHGTFWILQRSGNNFDAVFAHGAPGNGIGGYDLASPDDRAFAFDYDGSGKLDHIALYRPGHGTFWILKRK